MKNFIIALLIVLFQTVSLLAETRHFEFGYEVVYEGLEPGAEVKMWAPLPQNNAHQKVGRLRMSPPLRARLTEDNFDNRMVFLEGKVPQRGTLRFTVQAQILREEWTTQNASRESEEPARFLTSSERVPVEGRVLKLLPSKLQELESVGEKARSIYDRVLEHLNYDKSKPGYGQGDSLWACDSKTGNCTDFHSLFASLARGVGIPVRFEMGFPVSTETGLREISGYHCWAAFYDEDVGWRPVDISEADKHPDKTDYYFGSLDAKRVTVSVGRDLVFEPPQQSGKLNFFYQPLLEQAGEKVEPAKWRVFSVAQ